MTPKSKKSPAKLPQRLETWCFAVRRLRIWINPPDESPRRPFMVLVLNLDKNLVQGITIVEEFPSVDQVRDALYEAMLHRSPGSQQRPHRPTEILFEELELTTALAPHLKKIGVKATHQPMTEIVDEVVHDFETELRGGQDDFPGLLSVEGVDPELVGDLFDAAAGFYRAAPWVHLTNLQPLAVRLASQPEPRFVVVMGNGGVEYGLSVYRDWGEFERMYSSVGDPMEKIPPKGIHSLLFDDVTMLPFDDLEAIEAHGWEVVNSQAYPLPMIYTPEGGVKRPGPDELVWYEGVMLTIPRFVSDHLKPDGKGDYHPSEASFVVSTNTGEVNVDIKYPAGDVPTLTRPIGMMDWEDYDADDPEVDFDFEAPLPFDRRAMEGMMAQHIGDIDEPEVDPEVNRAQNLMYQAWDEQNPAKRITLAHEALSISPDCADAYVLLAEEEADTLGRALEYYQKGVEAGERSLGEAYFEEEVGYFWGYLETRPYMRAREGLAHTLWELGRLEEACLHYADMLRLNPNDNQGVRYNLLNLYLHLERYAEAESLLDQYQEDGSAAWLYTRALMTFRKSGAASESKRLLEEALEVNPHIPKYLTGRKRIPNRLPEYISWGRDSEAVHYANDFLNYWRKTPGAVAWLKAHSS